MLRKICAVIVGLIAGGIANMAIVILSSMFYPHPEGMDFNDAEALRISIKDMQCNCMSSVGLLMWCRRFVQASREGSVAALKKARGIETGLWLCPIEDRRHEGLKRTGLLEGFSLGSYLQLVDYTSQLVRQGKARVSRKVASLLTRLGTSVDRWQQTLTKMLSRTSPQGVAFAFHREHLASAAAKRGCHHLANLNGCPS